MLTPIRGGELAFPLPTDFGATDEEMREWAVADFVGFIREWRKRAQAAGCFSREIEQPPPSPSVDGGPGGGPAAAPDVSAMGTPTSPEFQSGSVPKPPAVERFCGDLTGPTEEEAASKAGKAKQLNKTNTLSAVDIIAELAKEGITGVDEAINGLHDLFGGGPES